jgi:hypothetical protein
MLLVSVAQPQVWLTNLIGVDVIDSTHAIVLC